MKQNTLTTLGGALAVCALALSANTNAVAGGRSAKVLHEFTLPPYSMANFGLTAEQLAIAQANGLLTTEAPSLGSGLERLVGNLYLGLTDRGPGGDHFKVISQNPCVVDPAVGDGKIFYLPTFCPSIVAFRAVSGQMLPELIIPKTDRDGYPVTGLPNLGAPSSLKDDVPFGAVCDPTPLAYDQSGLDTEAVRLLPNGMFVVVDEYSPSIVILSSEGQVLVRSTPVSKPLPFAKYTVKNILPDVLLNRRNNRGFENVAVSPDGKTLYAITQAPVGSNKNAPDKDSRVLRMLKIDLSDPLNVEAADIKQYVVLTTPAAEYPAPTAQVDLKVSDMDWVAPDKLLILERATGEVKLLLVDLSTASEVSELSLAALEGFAGQPASPLPPGVTAAASQEVFSMLKELPQIGTEKLEGLSILNRNDVAIANDNDFGVGDGVGLASKMWIIRLKDQLPLCR